MARSTIRTWNRTSIQQRIGTVINNNVVYVKGSSGEVKGTWLAMLYDLDCSLSHVATFNSHLLDGTATSTITTHLTPAQATQLIMYESPEYSFHLGPLPVRNGDTITPDPFTT